MTAIPDADGATAHERTTVAETASVVDLWPPDAAVAADARRKNAQTAEDGPCDIGDASTIANDPVGGNETSGPRRDFRKRHGETVIRGAGNIEIEGRKAQNGAARGLHDA
ncbi:MAG TPA: hypothetical protein VL309_07120 [Vicinamibacterales bacterium]|nr:hypothetical protein [Vicinamibacterales bacterium]